MSVPVWLRHSRRPSSPSESSTPESFDPASSQRVFDASPGPATAGRLLRRSAAALLLALLPQGMLAPPALAQTPTLSVSGVNSSSESSNFNCNTVRSGTILSPLTINLAITQTGDFLRPGRAGNKSVERSTSLAAAYAIFLDNDNVDEPNGSVTCTLLPGTGYIVGTASQTTRIIDDDPTIVSLARPDSGTVVEGATAEFTVTLGRALVSGEIVDVPLAVGGTASADDRSLALKSGGSLNTGVTLTGQATATPKLRFSGAAAQTATLVLTATDDTAPELFETVTVALGPDGTGTNGFDRSSLGTNVGGGADPHGTNKAFTVRIRDNDRTEEVENRPVVYLQHAVSGGYETDEGDPAKAVLAVFPPQDTETVVGITCTDGTATGSGAGADHTCPSTVTVPRWTPRLTFDIPTTADEAGEGDETFTVTITSVPAGFQVGTGRWTEAEVTIVDDEPTVTVTAGSPVTEGGDAVFTVHASPAPASDLTVSLSVTENASAFYGDFVSDEGSKTVTVLANATTATLTVPTDNDTTDEPAGEVTARLVRSSAYAVGGPSSAAVHVADDDFGTLLARRAPPRFVTVEFEGEDSEVRLPVPPGVGGHMQFVLSTAAHYPGTKGGYDCRGGPHVVDSKFERALIKEEVGDPGYYATTQGYIVHTRDLSGLTHVDLPVRLCSGAVGKSFQVLWHRTRAFDGNAPNCTKEWGPTSALCRTTVTVVEKGSGGPFLEAQFSEQIVATPPAVTISADRTSVTEGGDVVFTVTADPAPASDLVVNVAADEEMGSGDDLVAVGHLETVTIRAGQASATWTLTTMSDDVQRDHGTVVGRIAEGDGYTVGEPSSVTVTLLDDDGVVPHNVPDSVVGDPVTPGVDPALVAEVTAKADGHSNPEAAARLRRIVKGMTGEDGGYTAQECRDTATRHGVLSTWKPWCDEIARREAHTPPVPQQQQVVTLPAVTVSAGADVTEGGDAVFTVTASPAPAAELSVTVTVATAGEFGVTAGSRTVPIPVTGSATLTLATANDEADEPDGSVSVTVAAGNGYTVGDPASGTVAVQDDDAPLPAVTVSAGDAVTEGGDATFTVTASPAPALSLAVSVTVAAKGDYGIASGTQTVSIPTTGSATLTLATANDDADEPNGSASVTVNAGDGYTVGDPASGTVSIADDDLPPPAVSIAATAASVTEGGAAAFTLTADRAPDADLTVTLSVAETGGGDHVAVADEGPAMAVIAKGTTEAAFSVATVDDDANEPDGSVTVTVKDGGGYTVPSPPGNAAAVTVSDNDAAALPSLSVADVTIKEGAWMEFTVRLSAPSAGGVSVKVSTRDSTPVSATARKDYWPLSGRTVSFRAGETERSVGVIVLDDSHDEEPETFEVVLSDARGAAIGDGVAVGTITNDDPLPGAWLARFGRAVAEQALDGIAARMTADRTPGLRGTIAGQALDFGGNAAGGPDLSQSPGSLSGAGGAGPGLLFGPGVEAQSRGMTMQEVLRGSSFSLTGEADGSGGTLSFWGGSPGSGGLVSGSRFAGSDASVRLDGETGAALLGTDYARGRWLVGFALSQVRAEGGYAGEGGSDCSGLPASVPASACAVAAQAGDGEVEASLTATIPYAALAVSERLRLWGAAGQGAGDVTVKTGSGGSYRADTAWSMAAAGLRGDLLAPPAPGSGSGAGSGSGSGIGPALALTSDALWVRTSSEKTGDLAASESDVSRLRLGLEGSWGVALSGGGSVTPKLELGARHDGGGAETGFGVELGGGLAWRDPKLGLTLDLSGRTLVAHDDGGLEDRGVSARLSYDPEPSSGRGLSLSLGQDWGGRAQGGLDALFQPEPLEDRAGSGGSHEATSRWGMEAAWGLPALGGRFTGSPYMGLGLATGARDYSLGWRLAPEAAAAPGLSFGLRATRRESDTASPEHILGIEATARW